MTRDVLEPTLCLALAPVHVGLAVTLAHPALDAPAAAPLFYASAGAWLAVAHRQRQAGCGWPTLYALPLAALLAVHLWNSGALDPARASAREAVAPAPTPRRLLGVPAPRVAPVFRPELRPRRILRVAADVVGRSVVFALRVAVGTPAWAWAAAVLFALYLDRKGR